MLLSDEDCTRIYNEANEIAVKNPPITTERIFKAMRQAHAQGFAAGASAQLSAEPVFFAYQYDDGTWHDGSATEHSVGMKHLYTRREA